MKSFRQMRINKYEELAEIARSKSSKTFRRSGKHLRTARRCEKRAAKLRAKENFS